MAKQDFIQPRFDGARFAENTLPLELARDLVAYETLIAELAKHLFIAEHNDRQRVPRGFTADFQLHLERVDPGSAKPLLCLVTAALFAGGTVGHDHHTYFERARELVTECIASPDDRLPAAFPRELLVHFNQIGRSLLNDERMELPAANGTLAVLTQDRRKRLVLAANAVYQREIQLSGTIGEADWEKSTFRLRLPDGSSAIVPMAENFHKQARLFGGKTRVQVTVKGIGTFDSWDKLQKVVDAQVSEIQPDFQLLGKLDSLCSLQNGWMDGEGIAPDKEKLVDVAIQMIGNYPEKIPFPLVIPTPEGNLLLEWNVRGDPSVDLNLATMHAQFHAFLPNNSELEREFSLTTDQSWKDFLTFLDGNVEHLAE
jgi:hypothetical protein